MLNSFYYVYFIQVSSGLLFWINYHFYFYEMTLKENNNFYSTEKNTEALIIYEPLARIICTCLRAILNIVSMQFDPSLRPF